MRQKLGQVVLLTCPTGGCLAPAGAALPPFQPGSAGAAARGADVPPGMRHRRCPLPPHQNCATAERLGVPDRYATRRVVAQRNELLRGMVAATRGGSNATLAAASSGDGGSGSGSGGGSTGRPLLLLDLDAMTKWLPLEVTLSPHDFHYQCHATTQSAFQSEARHVLRCHWPAQAA